MGILSSPPTNSCFLSREEFELMQDNLAIRRKNQAETNIDRNK